jgi:hypothetical protein
VTPAVQSSNENLAALWALLSFSGLDRGNVTTSRLKRKKKNKQIYLYRGKRKHHNGNKSPRNSCFSIA